MPVAPHATLFTYTIAHVPVAPAFGHLDRLIPAIVELANGIRIVTTIEAAEPQELQIGMSLQAVFDDQAYAGVTLLRFSPSAVTGH